MAKLLCVTTAALIAAATGSPRSASIAARCEQPAGSAAQPRSSGGQRQLNDRAFAQFVITRDVPPGRTQGFIVVARGSANWGGNETRSSGRETFSPKSKHVRGSVSL